MFLLYSLVYSLGLVLLAPYYLWRKRVVGRAGGHWRERFGALPDGVEAGEPGAIWVHAVSVGETLAVVELVHGLQERYPSRKVFLSHVTPTGREAGEQRLPGVAGRFFLPFDWAWSVRRVLERIRPALLLVVETELWPNLLRETHKFGARIALVNARLSDRSFRGYRWVRPLMRRVLEPMEWVCAQTVPDSERFLALGARAERVVVTGNLKFDAKPPRVEAATLLKNALDQAGRGPVLVAASTMAGEESILLESWEAVVRRHSRSMFFLAPRHPGRFAEVAELLARSKRTFVQRSDLEMDVAKLPGQLAGPEVLLLDSMGELAGVLELADLVFVGGSLVPAGGHNLLEPAYWGKPILIGPHMENFRELARRFLDAGACLEVGDAGELARRAIELLDNAALRREMGGKAKRALQEAAGATGRTLDRLQESLGADLPAPAGA